MIGESRMDLAGLRGRAFLVLMIGGAVLAWPGCGGRDPRPAVDAVRPANADRGGRQQPPATGAVTTADYMLKGVVRAVSPETGRVLIRHEKIPGFMDAMTMPFQPADESILGLLHPGDQVEGILHVEKQDGAVRDYQLRDLKVTKPAAPKALTVDVSKGKVQLRQQPPRLQVGEEVPEFVMTGQDGRPIKLSDLRGKVVVLTFIYTRCPMPDFCPLMDRKFSELAQHLALSPSGRRT